MNKLNLYKEADPLKKAKLNDSTKKWRINNPDKIKFIRQKADAKRKEQRRDKELQQAFGITLKDYNELHKAQAGVCALCLNPEILKDRGGNIRPLCVDHCHTTGKVRGLLCANCNLGLGHFKDNSTVLQKAIKYLENK